jgi:transcriptional regulator with XRE-family HTH domain
MGYCGKKITELRLEKGWSMAKLARLAKLSQPSVWDLENQVTKKPRHETLTNIALALGVPVKVILSKKTPKGELPTADDLEAVWEALDDRNKQVLMIAAKALLTHQNPPKE